MTDLANIKFDRDAWGRLVMTLDDGQVHVGVEPVVVFRCQTPTKQLPCSTLKVMSY